MTKATRTILVLAIAAPLVCGGLYLGIRPLVHSFQVQQQQAAERRAQQAAQDAIEREAALKEKRRAAAMNVPLTTLGQPSPKSALAQGAASVPRPAPGKIEIVQLGGERKASTPPSPVQGSKPPKADAPPKFEVAPITIAPKASRIEVAAAEAAPKTIASTAITPMTANASAGLSTSPLALRDSPKSELEPTATPSPAASGDLMQPMAAIASSPASRAIPLGTVAGIEKELPPPLEEERVKQEKLLTAEQDTVKIVTGFECSTPLDIKKISPTHYAVTITTDSELKNWFMFKVVGVKGKTVRIDIQEAPLGKWWSLNPVYSYVSSLDDLDSFSTTPVANPKNPQKAHNGPLLPDTSGQKWHYMPNVWTEQAGWTGASGAMKTPAGQLCMVHTFDEDSAFVAMRVPYTVKYNEAYLASIKDRPGVQVIEVGKSKERRPLQVVRIGNGDPKTVPCILMYAREHGSEHDSSWAVQGAIDWLTSNEPEAQALRSQTTFLAIPMLDPDAAVAAKYEMITQRFVYDGQEGREARAYASFFKKWVTAGNRLDLTLNLHNVESAEGSHIFCPVVEPEPNRKSVSVAYHDGLMRSFAAAGYQTTTKPLGARTTWFRLSGYLSLMYGPLSMPYELNSQERERHLATAHLREMGSLLMLRTGGFFETSRGQAVLAAATETRQKHNKRMETYGAIFAKEKVSNALQVEWVSLEYDQAASKKNAAVK